MQKPSLTSVARAAGVSPSTVSNAYNKPGQLSAAVRERVLAVAAEQGYAGPDPAARSLRSRRTGAIGVLFTAPLSYALSDPYCAAMLTGVMEVAERARAGLLLIPLDWDAGAFELDQAYGSVEQVRHAVIDGAIADGIPDDHPALEIFSRRGLPLVRTVDRPGSRCVVIDDHDAGRRVGALVSGLGHREVGILADGPRPELFFPYAQTRLDGMKTGLGPDAHVTVRHVLGNTVEAGRAAALALLDAEPRPSALLAVTDVLALGALEALHQRGLTPGRDVSVTGFDDVSAAAGAGLTTVRQPVREKGRVMGRMLLDPGFTEQRVVLATDLIERASTGSAKHA